MIFEQKKATNKQFFDDLDRFGRRINWWKVLIVFFGLIVAVLVTVLTTYILVMTGLVGLPIVSNYFYKNDPTPLETIEPDRVWKLDDLVFVEIGKLDNDQTQQMLTEGLDLPISDAELTAVLQNPAQDGSLSYKQAQVSLGNGQLEWYAKLVVSAKLKPLIIRAILDSNLDNELELSQIFLGNLKFSGDIAYKVSRLLLGINSNSGADFFDKMINRDLVYPRWQVRSVKIEDDLIVLSLAPDSIKSLIEK